MGNIAAAIADAFELTTGTAEVQPALEAINALFQAGPIWTEQDWEDATAPKDYLNYILFDSDYIPYDMGFDQIDKDFLENGTDIPHDDLSLQAVATKPGYIYIYLSNESEKVVDVYFDNLLITHKYSPIVAGADYYPFGLVMEGREVTQEDWRYGYQGAFAEEDEETGYTAFELRMYDARFGRWTSTDPYGQYWSPYVGMGNMPQMGVDPDGGTVIGPPLGEVVIMGTRNAALKAAAASVMSNVFSSIVRGSGGGCCPGRCCPDFGIQGGEISYYCSPRNKETGRFIQLLILGVPVRKSGKSTIPGPVPGRRLL